MSLRTHTTRFRDSYHPSTIRKEVQEPQDPHHQVQEQLLPFNHQEGWYRSLRSHTTRFRDSYYPSTIRKEVQEPQDPHHQVQGQLSPLDHQEGGTGGDNFTELFPQSLDSLSRPVHLMFSIFNTRLLIITFFSFFFYFLQLVVVCLDNTHKMPVERSRPGSVFREKHRRRFGPRPFVRTQNRFNIQQHTHNAGGTQQARQRLQGEALSTIRAETLRQDSKQVQYPTTHTQCWWNAAGQAASTGRSSVDDSGRDPSSGLKTDSISNNTHTMLVEHSRPGSVYREKLCRRFGPRPFVRTQNRFNIQQHTHNAGSIPPPADREDSGEWSQHLKQVQYRPLLTGRIQESGPNI
ncbi:uncharacterized protein LOC132385723 [Hypanus sabinus]|uniref:uncharacterized protein LOC132385723 n=1 Tax=Hypanus sabinus TaxID=79690 RepID=UPI0028C3B564|nr:uncharacterized protein LOC132385723 [Hypanus sabinus]